MFTLHMHVLRFILIILRLSDEIITFYFEKEQNFIGMLSTCYLQTGFTEEV